ncbi:MAG TPA: YihY/virulence factor BrkB family protein [Nocardioidaceae bacterium]|nr:YihY/virulence factor BrkB family protein [Nocardioidaceae bacterium]
MDLGAAWRRVERTVARVRERSTFLDHVAASIGHYGRVDGSGWAGSVTYFAFLAFFPIMALAFFLVGLLARSGGQQDLEKVLDRLLPDLIGSGSGQIELAVFSENAGRVGLLGLLGFLYAGLGWMSAMRNALQAMFEKPVKDRPDLLRGKLRDLVTLAAVGGMLLLAYAVTTAANSFSDEILDRLGIDTDANLPKATLWVLSVLLALVLITSLLMVLYQLLARPRVSHRALREGALLAALGFVALKLVADKLITLTHGQPAFRVFGFALVLLVLINYFSRVVMFGASWAYTSSREPDLFEDEQPGPHWRSPA